MDLIAILVGRAGCAQYQKDKTEETLQRHLHALIVIRARVDLEAGLKNLLS
ncbi:MAG: hypothetical protein K8S20_13935 [Chloroflexi bacterium]|nr:hypothetical protein [Chloroflexota bacterium]